MENTDSKDLNLRGFSALGETSDTKTVDYLKQCVEHPDYTNIGLSGNFGSGKSTIINHFIKNNNGQKKKEKKNIIKVSFANIIKDKPFLPDEEIEKGIVAHFKMFNVRTPKRVITVMLCIILLVCTSLLIFSQPIKNDVIQILNHDCYLKYKKIIISSVYILFFSSLIYIIIYFYKKIRVISLKILGAEFNIVSKTEKNEPIFNNLFSIKKFFLDNKIDVLIFEDLDRCCNKNIFNKLRDLNLMLNNDFICKRKISFIYVISDSVFDDAYCKTKFLDIDIPVYPIISSNASLDILIYNFSSFKGKISERILKCIAPYIYDMRIINDIYNEFQISIKSDSFKRIESFFNIYDRMLAFCVFKIMYPKEYVKIQSGTSCLDVFFDNYKMSFLNKSYAQQNLTDNVILSKLLLLKNKVIDYINKNLNLKIDDFKIKRSNIEFDYPYDFRQCRLKDMDFLIFEEGTISIQEFEVQMQTFLTEENILIHNFFNRELTVKEYLDIFAISFGITDNLLVDLLSNEFIKQDFSYFFYINDALYLSEKDRLFLNYIFNNDYSNDFKVYIFDSPERVISKLLSWKETAIKLLAKNRFFNISLVEYILSGNLNQKFLDEYISNLEINDQFFTNMSITLNQNSKLVKKIFEFVIIDDDFIETYIKCCYKKKTSIMSITDMLCFVDYREFIKNEDIVKKLFAEDTTWVLAFYKYMNKEIIKLIRNNKYDLTAFINCQDLAHFLFDNDLFTRSYNNYHFIVENLFQFSKRGLLTSIKNNYHAKKLLSDEKFYTFYYAYCEQEDFDNIVEYILPKNHTDEMIRFLKECEYEIQDLEHIIDDIDSKLLNIFINYNKVAKSKKNNYLIQGKTKQNEYHQIDISELDIDELLPYQVEELEKNRKLYLRKFSFTKLIELFFYTKNPRILSSIRNEFVIRGMTDLIDLLIEKKSFVNLNKDEYGVIRKSIKKLSQYEYDVNKYDILFSSSDIMYYLDLLEKYKYISFINVPKTKNKLITIKLRKKFFD